MAPHTILFIAANPVGTDARALDKTARAVQVELERAGRRDCFKFETRWAAQPLDLLQEMVKLKPTVVHFCGGKTIGAGTSAPAAGVYFQATDGRAQLVPAKALARAFEAAGSVKLVVLDACYSEEHAAAVVAQIDCVVGMAGETIDGAATSFAIGLYGGLGEGESVAAAFKQGCAAIGMTGAGDPDQPQLQVRPGIDACRLVLTDCRETADRAHCDQLADVYAEWFRVVQTRLSNADHELQQARLIFQKERPDADEAMRGRRHIQEGLRFTAELRIASAAVLLLEDDEQLRQCVEATFAPIFGGPMMANAALQTAVKCHVEVLTRRTAVEALYSDVARRYRRMNAEMKQTEPLPEAGARQRGIEAAGNVTARDETGVGASQDNVKSGGDVNAIVTARCGCGTREER